MRKDVKLDVLVWLKLQKIKLRTNARSLNNVIRDLINKYKEVNKNANT